MPRKSNIAKPGVRRYGMKSNYTPEILQEALSKIQSGALTRMEAAKTYNIPHVTLFYKLKQKHCKSVGRPIALSETEEENFKNHLLVLSDLGIPISMLDLRMIVKKYLDANNKKIEQFQNNMPGYEWGTLFLERHPDLKIKVAHNIPRKRAQVNREQIEVFFANLSKEIEGIPPENIFNMDESGFHDDPGKKKLIFRRDSRHSEVIKNATKSCYTVVFCVNAAGQSLPPFFIFKGKKLWSDWLYQAPEGSRMAVSDSGWITTEAFEEWLEKHFIPHVSKLEGKKMLCCDNFSAHISPKALQLCEEHNIVFICLIPNSTHLVQPLDVGYFSSLKTIWRKVLNNYRQTNRGKKVMALPKSLFAQLLRKALTLGEATREDNIKAGFRSTGIFPFSPETVLNKLPKYTSEVEVRESVGEAFQTFVEEVRSADLYGASKVKKFQLPVIAGKSVSAEEVAKFYEEKAKAKTSQCQDKETDTLSKKNNRNIIIGRPAGSKNKKKMKIITPKEVESDKIPSEGGSKENTNAHTIIVEDEIHKFEKNLSPDIVEKDDEIQRIDDESRMPIGFSEEIWHLGNNTTEEQDPDELTVLEEYVVNSDGSLISQEVFNNDKKKQSEETINNNIEGHRDDLRQGMFCIFKEEGSLFPGCIDKLMSDYVSVRCLQKQSLGGWAWYQKPEKCKIKKESIIAIIKESQMTKKDGKIIIDDDILFMEWGE